MSKVVRLWDRGDFRSIATIPEADVPRGDQNKHKESQAAVRLLDLAAEYPKVPSGGLKSSAIMKVVTILHASLPHHTGGYTSRAQGLLSALVENDVVLAAYTRPGFYEQVISGEVEPPYPDGKVDNVLYQHLPALRERRSGEYRYMLTTIDQYREIFQREAPNVVHVRSTYLIALPAMIAAHSLGIPVLYEVSGLWELVYEGRGLTGKAQRTVIMENATVANADRVVTMNDSMAELLEGRSKVPLEVGLVPNAVTPERFSNVLPLGGITPDYDLGYVGSLVDYEGHALLVKAISYLRSKGQEVRVKIVGKGAELERISTFIGEEGVKDLINLAGPVPPDQVMEEFNHFTAVVLPRLSTPATENVTPLKPFEAMAARRPLIVSDVKALEEISQGGKTAEVFKSGDYKSLAGAIQRVLNSEARQQSLVERSFELINRQHTWEYVGKIMERELRATAAVKKSLPVQPSSNVEISFGAINLASGLVKGIK